MTEEGESDVGILKTKNLKLEQALTGLYKKYESEKQLNEEKLKRLNEKVAQIPKIEEKDKQIQNLTDTLKKKEYEIEELTFRVDEGSDAMNMIEEMSTQIMQKEDEIIEMRRDLTQLKLGQKADRELQDEQDDYIKLLEKDLQDRDYKIVVLTQSVSEQHTLVEEKEKQYNRLKDKLSDISNQLSIYKEQETDTEKTKAIQRIDELLEKQHELTTDYSTMYRQYIKGQSQLLKMKGELTRAVIMVGPLPPQFIKKLQLEPLSRYLQTFMIRERATLLIKEAFCQVHREE